MLDEQTSKPTSGSLRFASVAPKRPGWSKLPKFVTHHFFGHKHFHVNPPVMNHKRVADELRYDGAGTGPSLDWFLEASGLLLFNLQIQLQIDVRAFFQ